MSILTSIMYCNRFFQLKFHIVLLFSNILEHKYNILPRHFETVTTNQTKLAIVRFNNV